MKIRRIATSILLAGIILSTLLWLLDGPPITAQGSFIKHTLAENVNSTRSVTTADLNGDGKIDIIAASPDEGSFQGQITWWEMAVVAILPNTLLITIITEPGL